MVMSEEKSYIFDFIRVPNFMDDYNLQFFVAEMDGTSKNYEFVLSQSCPDNIEDCLNDDGGLNSNVATVDIGTQGEISLLYSKGVNNSRVITLSASSVVLDVGDIDVMMKGLFLRDISTGYVLAYCILQRTVPITNEVIFPASGVVWNIRNEV